LSYILVYIYYIIFVNRQILVLSSFYRAEKYTDVKLILSNCFLWFNMFVWSRKWQLC